MEIPHFLGGIYPSNILYPYPKARPHLHSIKKWKKVLGKMLFFSMPSFFVRCSESAFICSFCRQALTFPLSASLWWISMGLLTQWRWFPQILRGPGIGPWCIPSTLTRRDDLIVLSWCCAVLCIWIMLNNSVWNIVMAVLETNLLPVILFSLALFPFLKFNSPSPEKFKHKLKFK